jgi:multiple sugar transport system permease protein
MSSIGTTGVQLRWSRGVRITKRALFYLGLTIVTVLFLMPIWIILTTSLRNRLETFNDVVVLFFKPTIENYVRVLAEGNFPRYFFNSFIIASSVTVLVSYLGALTAFALTRFLFKGYRTVAFSIIAARMFPPIALLPAFFLLASRLHLVDTRFVVIFAHTAYGLPFIVFMMLGFFYAVPRDLDEAARIDGCSWFGVFNRVLLPNVAPGLAAAAILSFVWSWNEFLFALVLTRATSKTLPVTVSEFLTFTQVDWQGLTSMGTILIVPAVIITVFAQKHLVRGLTAGAVKT